MSRGRFYDDDEAEQILKLAAKRMGQRGSVPREQLLQSAAELGISAEELQEAEAEFERTRNEQAERREFDTHIRRDFMGHFVAYLIVNSGLFLMDLMKDGRVTWAYWPILGWGIGLAFCAWEAFAKGSDDYEKEFEKWRRQRHQSRTTTNDAQPILADIARSIDIDRNKIQAIKELRERTGMQLKDAKDAVDQYVGS
jgi:hypothetical protein